MSDIRIMRKQECRLKIRTAEKRAGRILHLFTDNRLLNRFGKNKNSFYICTGMIDRDLVGKQSARMDRIRFGVVGTNFITGWVIAGASLDSRFELAAVCSRTEERAEEFARRYNIPHRFTSLEEMAASPLIDAVYIASPNFMHASQSILCMSCGKHVLCEKPLASNERYNVTLMEAMKPTLTPNFKAVTDSLGKAGKVRRYFSSYCQYSSRYDRFKAGEPVNAFNPEYSNGAIMDIGVYTIYPMVVLFGMPEQITASGTVLSSGADGQGSAVFRYGSGMEASVIYSKIADSYLPSEIQGEDGTIIIDRINLIGNVSFIPRRRNVTGGRGEQPVIETLSRPSGMDEYYYEVAEFMDMVLSGRRESCINSHRNSLAVMEIADEIRRQTGVVFPADNL